MGISLFMNFQVGKRLFSLFSKQPPTSRTGGKPTASRRMKVQAHYFQPHPLGMTSGMPSRSSTTLSKAMRTNTSNGPHCGRDETKMFQSSQTFFIPFAHSWVSKILSGIWCSNTAAAYTDTSRKRWSSWTSPHSAQHTVTLSKSSKSSNRRRETLDLQIRSPKDKTKAG